MKWLNAGFQDRGVLTEFSQEQNDGNGSIDYVWNESDGSQTKLEHKVNGDIGLVRRVVGKSFKEEISPSIGRKQDEWTVERINKVRTYVAEAKTGKDSLRWNRIIPMFEHGMLGLPATEGNEILMERRTKAIRVGYMIYSSHALHDADRFACAWEHERGG
jgi:hypothetical protein